MRKFTNNQEEIRRWANGRSAHPVEYAPFMPDGEPAQLGFVFGDVPAQQENLQPITWARFFAVFGLMGLVLAYDDDKAYELLKTEDHSAGRYEGKPLQA